MYSMGNESFSEVLRRAIADSGESLGALSRRSGVDTSMLSRFVRGKQGLTSASIDALVEALGIEVKVRRPKPGGSARWYDPFDYLDNKGN
jgi:hypothetical protein